MDREFLVTKKKGLGIFDWQMQLIIEWAAVWKIW